VAEYVVFAAGSPGAPDEADGPIALATGFEIISPGNYWVTHIEWFVPTNTPSGVEVAIWARTDDATPGANLTGNLAWAGPFVNGTRNRFTLPTPILVTTALYPNGLYAVLKTGNRYTATAAYFNATGETNGPLRAWVKQLNKANGRFKVSPVPVDAEYPNNDFNGGGYWISPVVTDVDPGGSPINITDTPGTSMAGGSPAPTAVGTVLTDTPGTGQAGGSPATVTTGVGITDTPGGAAAGGSPDQALTNVTITIVDAPGTSFAGGSGATVTAADTLADLSVWPLLAGALVCLQDAMGEVESPPKYVSIRPGLAFSAGLSQMEDECCEGSAWIRVVNIVPTDDFPTPRAGASNCAPAALAVELELGALRCRPTSSNLDASRIVTSAQWAEMTRLVMSDAAALRRAACCIAGLVGNSTIGTWTPQAVEANCMGGTMTMTIQAPNCEISC
jgi:hypothetical protein